MTRKRASGTCPRCQDRSVEMRDEVKAEWRTFHLDELHPGPSTWTSGCPDEIDRTEQTRRGARGFCEA
eukprot:5774031-Prymnesium_polylepis.1